MKTRLFISMCCVMATMLLCTSCTKTKSCKCRTHVADYSTSEVTEITKVYELADEGVSSCAELERKLNNNNNSGYHIDCSLF